MARRGPEDIQTVEEWQKTLEQSGGFDDFKCMAAHIIADLRGYTARKSEIFGPDRDDLANALAALCRMKGAIY